MADDPKNIIEFHYHRPDEPPRPFPATKAIPDWMKNMAPEVPPEHELVKGEKVFTVKKCAPFLDAMTCGYMIPIAADVRFFFRDEHHLDFDTSQPVIGTQISAQFANSPMAGGLLVKFINIWVIKTPPGYSTLFLPPMNHFGLPFHILAGIVDTDTYYKQIHFPAICLMKQGDRFLLEKGTPIVQAIPIKRESWKAEFPVWDLERVQEMDVEAAANQHFYKDKYWVKKDYR